MWNTIYFLVTFNKTDTSFIIFHYLCLLFTYVSCLLLTRLTREEYVNFSCSIILDVYGDLCLSQLEVHIYHLSPKFSTLILTLFRMGFFGAAHGWNEGGGGGKKSPSSLKFLTHILKWWNLAQLYLTQRTSKKCMNHVTNLLCSPDISIFSREIQI